MIAFLKKLTAHLPLGPTLVPLDLDAHWPDIERLLAAEEWPFVRADLEAGHAQPGAVGRVALVGGAFAGFFTTHRFGDVGYLDMMIVDPAFRGRTVARPLFFRTLFALRRRGLVAHTTRDSARMIHLLGFRPGQDFTLLARDPGNAEGEPAETPDLDSVIALDAAVFGQARPAWIRALRADFRGIRHGGVFVATCALRPRRGGALCLDDVCAPDPDDVPLLVRAVVAEHGDRRLECFARTGSALHAVLLEEGFAVPDFFVPIGPLVEWRRGRTAGVGDGDRIECLMWL